MATRDILPRVNSSGTFKLKSPLENLLKEPAWYTCIAVRKLEEIKILGDDPFEKYYKPLSLPKDQYEKDYANESCIITLNSDHGDLYHIPSSYLLSFPSGTGVLYSVISGVIDFGPIPLEMDLKALESDLIDVVRDRLGVNARMRLVNLSDTQIVTQKTHERVESARRANISSSPTMRSKLNALESENALLKTKVEELERYILSQTP